MSNDNPFKFVKSISSDKEYLEDLTGYNEFIVRRAFSYYIDTIMFANDINSSDIDPEMQYDYLFHSIRKAKRFKKWPKKPKSEHLEMIMNCYSCGYKEGMEILDLLGDDEIEYIKKITKIGGKK